VIGRLAHGERLLENWDGVASLEAFTESIDMFQFRVDGSSAWLGCDIKIMERQEPYSNLDSLLFNRFCRVRLEISLPLIDRS
jgi:hypothetical protein